MLKKALWSPPCACSQGTGSEHLGYITIKEMPKLQPLRLTAAPSQAWQHFSNSSTCKYFMFAFLASDASLYIKSVFKQAAFQY